MNKQELIEKYRLHRKAIINPDDITDWSDLGFDEPPDGYEDTPESIMDYLDREGQEFDEGEQLALGLVAEFIEELEKME